MMFARRWEELSWAALQAAPEMAGLVPVGGIEQHGASLPMGTDSIVARAVCAATRERCDAVVLPAIDIGCAADDDVVLPGALSVGATQLVALAVRFSEGAAQSGVRRLVFVDAGAGNARPLAQAVDRLAAVRPDLEVAIRPWWSLDDDVAAVVGAAGDGAAFHGGRAEASIVLAVAPELVRPEPGTAGPPSADLGLELLEGAADALARLVDAPTLAPAPAAAPALA